VTGQQQLYDRKRISEHLYGKREWTMERIAEALNVSKKTISLDLSEIVTEGNNSKPLALRINAWAPAGRAMT
jgi:hypothetical protein